MTAPPISLLIGLRLAGFALRADGDRLLVSPASKLTDDQRAAVKGHKADLLALVRPSPPTLTDRAIAQGWCPFDHPEIVSGGRYVAVDLGDGRAHVVPEAEFDAFVARMAAWEEIAKAWAVKHPPKAGRKNGGAQRGLGYTRECLADPEDGR